MNKRFGNMKAPTSHGNAGHPSGTGDHLEDLRREVDIMRALNHPNLVKLYEVIDDKVSGKILMVVEFCEAGALVSPGQLTPERRMPEAIAQFYFRQMVSGIAYLHENSVIHGDMKPENVLLSGDATVKIADFGQSQFMSGGEDTLRRTLGTPAFLAPEICAGEDYRGRPADVWALGVSLYGFIYGELPFKGDSLMELYEDIAEAVVPFPPSVAVSMELQDLLLRALHKDPEARITAEEMLKHPWVREDDLFTLMPSLFSEDAMIEGGAYLDGGLGGVSPRPISPTRVNLNIPLPSGGAGAGVGGGVGGGPSNADGDASDSNSGHGSRSASDASSLPLSSVTAGGAGAGGAGAPSAADVAAAVFPSLFSMRRSNQSGGKGSKKSRGGGEEGGIEDDDQDTGAFTLGPESSIIGALQQVRHAPKKPGSRPTERLHYLSTDSMVRRRSLKNEDEVDEEDGEGEASGGDSDEETKIAFQRKDTGRYNSSSLSHSKSPAKNRKENKLEAVAEVGSSGEASGSGVAEHRGVERSKPSAFTVMAQQAQKVQAELIAKQNTTDTGTAAAPGGLPARALSGALETIGEEASEDLNTPSTAMDAQFSSLMSMPSGSYEIIEAPVGHTAEPPLPLMSEEERISKNLKPGGGFLGKKKTSSLAIPAPSGSSGLTEITWTTSSGVQQSSQSLTFGYGSGRDSLPFSSPFDAMEPESALSRNSVPSTAPSIAADSGGIAGGDGNSGGGGDSSSKEKEIATAVDNLTTTQEEDTTTSACEIEEEEGTEQEREKETDSSSLPSASPPRSKMQNFLQKMSFKGNNNVGESTAEQDSEAAPSLDKPTISSLPSEVDPTIPPIQWKMYRPGQKLHFQMSSHNQSCTNTVYYIESGMVELRWEASLAVPLTRLLSTMQHPSHKFSGSASTTSSTLNVNTSNLSDKSSGRPNSANASYMNRIDSVALATNKVTTLRPGSAGGSNNSRDNGLDRSETMANTLQQASERAVALMVNATGGSLDNLLLSHRGASQFVGALSMLDPDYFADRWKATAIAQTELVVIQMTRAGLDDFLSQNPLAQVHLRASMARGQAEVTKLEALERIADAHRKKRYPKLKTKVERKSSWKFSDVFGVSLADAAEAVGLTDDAEEASMVKTGRDGDANAQETAGLDVFALVSKLRGEQGTTWD